MEVATVRVEMAYCGDWGDKQVWANLQHFITTYETTNFHTGSPLLLNEGNGVSIYVVTQNRNIVQGGCGSKAVRRRTGYVSGKFYYLLTTVLGGKNRP